MADDHLSDLLTLDSVVCHDYWTDVLDAVRDAHAAHDVQAANTVVDLGSGTGTGALGLAERFPSAEVIAVDSSPDMIAVLRGKGINALLADLDVGWPAITDIDVTFASMSLHHVADPARTLRELFAATRPGGIVAAAEFHEPLRVLRDEYGDGLEQRTMTAVRSGHPMPELHSDWRSLLTAAGFEPAGDLTFTIDRPAPTDDDSRRYAQLWLSRLRQAGDEQLSPADKAALDAALSDPDALHLHGERTLTIGRRPH